MNKFHQAYIDLGLQPGGSLDEIQERWRTVARMWHPDRAGSAEEKVLAEIELKKINAARDLLDRHFKSGEHGGTNCECSLNASTPPPSASPPPSPPPPSRAATAPARRPVARNHPFRNPVMAVITVAMVVLGWSFSHMNSGIKIKRPEMPTYEAYAATPHMEPLRIEAPRATDRKVHVGADSSPARAAETPKPANIATPINFVSSDGRLVSLKDGTTWELWQTEAADSFFQWEPGDRVTVKGLESNPSWLVNETRSFQAVKATPVR